MARQGKARPGPAWQGPARQGKAHIRSSPFGGIDRVKQTMRVNMGPIKRFSGVQVITSKYGIRNGKMHRGVDLRSVRFLSGKGFVNQWALQDVIATERCRVKRQGIDSYGNNFLVVEPLVSYVYGFKELKYIHITPTNFNIGTILEKGDYIGKTSLKGNSRGHHLHFETWKDVPYDPLNYFYLMDIAWRMK